MDTRRDFREQARWMTELVLLFMLGSCGVDEEAKDTELVL